MDTVVEADAVELKHEWFNSDPFCDVRLVNIKHGGRETDKFMIELQQPNTQLYREIPGVGAVHTANYHLVPNRQVHDIAMDVLNKTGMTFEPVPSFASGHSQPILWDGKRYVERWFTKDVKVTGPKAFPGGQRRDMMMGMEVRNSYDGSYKVGLAFFAMYCACSNQFHATNLLGAPFEFPHVNRGEGFEGDFQLALDTVTEKAANFHNIQKALDVLAETRVTGMSDFLDLRQRLKNNTRVEFRDKNLLDELAGCGITQEIGLPEMAREAYKDPSTYWAISNAFTAITTHGVPGVRGAEQGRRITDFLIEDAYKRTAAVAAA